MYILRGVSFLLFAQMSMVTNASPFYVSMVELIIAPERYLGKDVILIGFNSRRTIFLTESAAKYRDVANSIRFSDKREGFYDHCEEAFVRIFGRVERDTAGGIFLQDVSTIYSMDEHRDCEASLKSTPKWE